MILVAWATGAAFSQGVLPWQISMPGGRSPCSRSRCPEGVPPWPIAVANLCSCFQEQLQRSTGTCRGGTSASACSPCPSPKQPIRECTRSLRGCPSTRYVLPLISGFPEDFFSIEDLLLTAFLLTWKSQHKGSRLCNGEWREARWDVKDTWGTCIFWRPRRFGIVPLKICRLFN